jgi:hypothetical protein
MNYKQWIARSSPTVPTIDTQPVRDSPASLFLREVTTELQKPVTLTIPHRYKLTTHSRS